MHSMNEASGKVRSPTKQKDVTASQNVVTMSRPINTSTGLPKFYASTMTAVRCGQLRGIRATCLLLWLHDGLISPKATAATAFIQFRQPWFDRSMKRRQAPTWESPSASTSSDARLSFWNAAGNMNQFQRRNCVSATRLNVASKKRSIPEGDRPSSTPASPMSFDSDDTSSWLTSELEGDEDIGAAFSSRQEEEESGSVHIPSGGISVSDAMEAAQLDRFVSSVIPVETLPQGSAAHIVTSSTTSASLEPSRYLVALSPPPSLAKVRAF